MCRLDTMGVSRQSRRTRIGEINETSGQGSLPSVPSHPIPSHGPSSLTITPPYHHKRNTLVTELCPRRHRRYVGAGSLPKRDRETNGTGQVVVPGSYLLFFPLFLFFPLSRSCGVVWDGMSPREPGKNTKQKRNHLFTKDLALPFVLWDGGWTGEIQRRDGSCLLRQ